MTRIGQLALTAFVAWLILSRVGLGVEDLRNLDPSLWKPDPVLLLASSTLLMVGFFVSSSLWGRIVVDLGGPRVPAPQAIRLFMIANLGRYVPGKVWQLAGLAVLAKRKGVQPATATGAAVLGQGVSLVAATLVGLGSLVRGPDSVRVWGTPVVVVAGVALVVGLLPPTFRGAVRLWFRMARQEPPKDLGVGHALRWLVLFTLNWTLYAFSFWVLARSLGHTAAPVAVASSYAAAYVLGYAAVFAPAGLAVREGVMIAILAPLLGVGPAGALAIIARLWATVVELVPAAAFWVHHMMRGGTADANGGEDAGE